MLRERKIWGPNVRLMEVARCRRPAARGHDARGLARWDLKRVVGGLLVQERDLLDPRPEELQVVTERRPDRDGAGRTCCLPGRSCGT